jgi:hypothetical protein
VRWVAPVALAVVFAWAGGAKFADQAGTREGFRALGLGHPEQRAVQVPSAELATAVLLIVPLLRKRAHPTRFLDRRGPQRPPGHAGRRDPGRPAGLNA